MYKLLKTTRGYYGFGYKLQMRKCFVDCYMIYMCYKICEKVTKQRTWDKKMFIFQLTRNAQFVDITQTSKYMIYRIQSVGINSMRLSDHRGIGVFFPIPVKTLQNIKHNKQYTTKYKNTIFCVLLCTIL